jgi:hypothetical protein
MRALNLCFLLVCQVTVTIGGGAQERKSGLYELTLTTTTVSPSPSTYPPRVSQVCLTQEMIDKYGAIVPDDVTKVCKLDNVVKKAGGMKSDFICSGSLVGKGTLEVNWSDSEHAKGVLHFSGTMRPGDKEIKIEWSAVTNSAYRGPDCGELKPVTPSQTPAAEASPPGQ